MRDRLVADLRRYYGVSLYEMYQGRESVQEVAAMAAHLPRGGAVAEWLGGWGAVTAEEAAIMSLEWTLVAINAKTRPKPLQPPVGVRDEELKAARRAEQMRRWRRKHGGGHG